MYLHKTCYNVFYLFLCTLLHIQYIGKYPLEIKLSTKLSAFSISPYFTLPPITVLQIIRLCPCPLEIITCTKSTTFLVSSFQTQKIQCPLSFASFAQPIYKCVLNHNIARLSHDITIIPFQNHLIKKSNAFSVSPFLHQPSIQVFQVTTLASCHLEITSFRKTSAFSVFILLTQPS